MTLRAHYDTRKLTEGYPALDRLAEKFIEDQRARDDDSRRLLHLIDLLGRLVDMSPGRAISVIGCGPVPQTIRVLRDRGHLVTGVEPIPAFVDSAAEYLGERDVVLRGVAESLPYADCSQDVVFFENVMEHVESPPQSLREIFRVLKPGGVVYLSTTNRLRFSAIGRNFEYSVPFFNWFPRLVQESYVFRHLHYDPRLANYSPRPAVHWFSFADLCALGRQAGFAQFYSPLDLRDRRDAQISGNPIKRFLLGRTPLLDVVQGNAWLRALALTQLGGDIIMYKRSG